VGSKCRLDANEPFVAVLNSRGVYFLNTPLLNRYSKSQCQLCIRNTYSVIYVANTNIKERCIYFYHILCQTKQLISNVAHELK